ncbi:hypothetical protein HYFRA_00005609, partial [Hymenoscyphus fraxineus]
SQTASSSRYPEVQQDEGSHKPPPYSGPATPVPPTIQTLESQQAPQRQAQQSTGIPKLDYSLYIPQTFTLSEDQTTITSHDKQLNTQRTSLLSLVQRLSSVPPKPEIRIIGKSTGAEIVDFDLRLNMMRLFVPDDERQRMNYIHVMPPGENGWRGKTKKSTEPALEGLESWVRRYCEDDTVAKEFVLERCIINWDTSHLEDRLYLLFRSIGYNGRVSIKFPATHTRVVVSPEDKRPRLIASMTKIFTNGPRRYEIVKSVWPYANVPRGEHGMLCVVQDEDAWFGEWKGAIAHAALCKRKEVWVAVEDQLEVLMTSRKGIADHEQGGFEWGTTSLSDEYHRRHYGLGTVVAVAEIK